MRNPFRTTVQKPWFLIQTNKWFQPWCHFVVRNRSRKYLQYYGYHHGFTKQTMVSTHGVISWCEVEFVHPQYVFGFDPSQQTNKFWDATRCAFLSRMGPSENVCEDEGLLMEFAGTHSHKWVWDKRRYPTWNPGKWKQRLNSANFWWVSFDSHATPKLGVRHGRTRVVLLPVMFDARMMKKIPFH